jgi:TPR repeat protein
VKRSAELLQKSADAEDGWAINNLAVLYEQGWGVARDPAKARSLYAKASALGIPVAELNIKRLEATSQPRP